MDYKIVVNFKFNYQMTLEHLSPKDREIIANSLPKFTVRDLAEHGAHYGHKTSRWNPEMGPYIIGTRSGIHIINLKKTHQLLTLALLNIYKEIKDGKSVLFVCTNISTNSVVREFAIKCGQPYVTHRWLGGMLTNWRTIVLSIKKIKKFETILSEKDEKGRHGVYSKKELGKISKELEKLKIYFDGLRSITTRPDNIIVFDSLKDDIAVQEAVKLCISPTVLVDTNASIKNIDYLIPTNNDSKKIVRFMANLMCETILQAMKDDVESYKFDVKNTDSEQKENKLSAAKEKLKLNLKSIKLENSPEIAKTEESVQQEVVAQA